MKKIFALLTSFIIFFAFSSLSLATESQTIHNKKMDAQKVQVLFVMLSKEATITKTDKPGVAKLTLKGVNQDVIYFSNRPNRISGHISTQKLIRAWLPNGVFYKDAPNAMMEAVKLNTKTDALQNNVSSYPIILTNPTYSTENKDELSFDIKSLTKKTLPVMRDGDYVAIFIDNICLSCIG